MASSMFSSGSSQPSEAGRPFQDRRRSDGKSYFRRDGGKNYTRKNDRIRAREVRVIDFNGEQLGIMQTADAVALAKSKGLDLIEISPNAQPPVCKILDFGKYKYDESKKNKRGSKSPSSKIKEVKLHVAIDQNDYNVKLKRSAEFLEKGFKLKVSLMFRGRELAHSEIGFDVMGRFLGDLSEYGTVDSEPKLFGKVMSTTVSPVPEQRRAAQSQRKAIQSTKVLDVSELLKL